jgi:hypothetical protein
VTDGDGQRSSPDIAQLYVICYMLYVVCCMLYVICCMLYVICYMLYVICYMLYVICYMLYVISYIVVLQLQKVQGRVARQTFYDWRMRYMRYKV